VTPADFVEFNFLRPQDYHGGDAKSKKNLLPFPASTRPVVASRDGNRLGNLMPSSKLLAKITTTAFPEALMINAKPSG
jgi:hypothetical protein